MWLLGSNAENAAHMCETCYSYEAICLVRLKSWPDESRRSTSAEAHSLGNTSRSDESERAEGVETYGDYLINIGKTINHPSG